MSFVSLCGRGKRALLVCWAAVLGSWSAFSFSQILTYAETRNRFIFFRADSSCFGFLSTHVFLPNSEQVHLCALFQGGSWGTVTERIFEKLKLKSSIYFFLSSCRTTVLLAGYWKQPCVLGNLEVSAILYNRSGSCVLCREIGVVLHSQHTGVVQVKI